MSGTFTPGPWRIRENGRHAPDECDLSICGDVFVLCDISGPNYAHCEANARLIAAAPELYAELQQFVNGVETRMIDSPADETLANITHRARNALAKARGEQVSA